MSAVETWRALPGGEIEFTMKRLRSADLLQMKVNNKKFVGCNFHKP